MTRQQPTLESPFGEVIAAWRAHRNMSSTELAERSGLAQSHISEIEGGKIGLPRKPTLEKLAQALQTDVWHLYTRQMPPADAGTGVSSTQTTVYAASQQRRGLARPALPIPLAVADLTPGQRIDRVIAVEHLSAEEEEALARHLAAIASELVTLIKATRDFGQFSTVPTADSPSRQGDASASSSTLPIEGKVDRSRNL